MTDYEPVAEGIQAHGLKMTGALWLAGVACEDILTHCDGTPLDEDSLATMAEAWSALPVGGRMAVRFLRKGQAMSLDLVRDLEKYLWVVEKP